MSAPIVETRQVAVGESELALEETPSTGYVWGLADAPPGVTLLGSSFVSTSAPPLAGGGGLRVFRLRVDRPGAFVLRFERKRPWEAAPLEVRTIELRAAPRD